MGKHVSPSLTLSTEAPQGCVLSPLLYSLYNLLLNISKTKELIGDFSTKQQRNYQPFIINGTPVERVDSFRYLGVHIMQDLSWSCHVNTLVKKAQHASLPSKTPKGLPSKVLKTFYTCTIESILTGSITAWFGNSTKQNRQALQRVVQSAEHTNHAELPDLETICSKRCWTKARKIMKDLSHPNNRLFSLLRSGKRFRSLKANTERRRSFFPQAIRGLNKNTYNLDFSLDFHKIEYYLSRLLHTQ
ncbi:hypothetical protein QTP86_012229 [Hemibagrus guttatus]|nr:hypothetical protein QTP86_012229 [Hemibagrus guttatus]